MSSIEDLDTPVDEALLRGGEANDEEAEVDEVSDEVGDTEAATNDEEAEDEPEIKKEEEHTIPKGRFNEVNERKKALEEEVAALRAMLEAKAKPEEPAEKPVDLKALRRQATEALMDGDLDTYDNLQEQIETMLVTKAEERAEARARERMEQDSFARAADELQSKYPVLHTETGDPEAIAMVIDLRDSYIAKGVNMTKALVDAAEKVAKLYGNKEVTKDDPVSEDPRKKKAVERGVDANNRTPPQGGGVGNRAQEPKSDATNIPQSKWEKLSQEERNKLLAA